MINNKKSITRHRGGFTLVEMLVAVALVVLMMLMFAQVFQSSAGLVSNQKGMAENDQAVRTLTILLRGDIKQRTFVDVIPFVANQNTGDSTVPFYDQRTRKGFEAEFRKGFFSISENDPFNLTDDVLHLTIRSDSPLSGRSRLPYSGKSRLLRTSTMPADDVQYLLANPDQPEFDDGQLSINNTGSSRYAEVCWFLRNGNLYRQIHLIRDPYNRGGNAGSANEPLDAAGNEFIPTAFNYDFDGDMVADEFWRRFDYSAYWELNEGLKFHTPDSLTNDFIDPPIPSIAGMPRSLGNPLLRFGNSVNRTSGGNILGPREFIFDGTQRRFIGRFTKQETSHPLFNYPGDIAGDPFAFNDPMIVDSDPPGRTFSINPATGLVNPYADANYRRGESLVMSNVHSFDIQVWDEGRAIPGFVDLGHREGQALNVALDGYFGRRAVPNHSFGNRFDTWHPSEFMQPAEPPYAPFDLVDATGTQVPRSNPPQLGLGSDGEVALKAIRIKIRFFDVGSDQMRDLTFTFRLNRTNSSD